MPPSLALTLPSLAPPPLQVLPARTHPLMMCSGTGGYILSGTKIQAGPDAKPLAAFLPRPPMPQAPQVRACEVGVHGRGQRAIGVLCPSAG